jgi:hypothetical protein
MKLVIPAKAGIQYRCNKTADDAICREPRFYNLRYWIPAFAGMTTVVARAGRNSIDGIQTPFNVMLSEAKHPPSFATKGDSSVASLPQNDNF